MAREEFVTVAGCKTKLLRAGEGPPLLFLHGAGGAAAWTPFMQSLSRQFDVFVPQHPGFDDSETPEWLDNVGDLAYFYLDFIRHFALTGLHLVGTSIGGWIACEAAVRDCRSLASLTLVAPAGLRLRGTPKTDIFMLPPQDYARRLFHDSRLADAVLARQPTDAELTAQIKNKLTTAKIGWSPRLFDPDLHKWLHRITPPTLILWGDDDQIIPTAYGPLFNALIPQSRLETIDNCGHLPHVEKADELAARIISFCFETRQ